MTLDWKHGTGMYIDGGTYAVKDDDGKAMLVFVANQPFGNPVARDVVRRDGTMVVLGRSGRGDNKDLAEVVLTEGLAGWWERSGRVVFSAVKPATSGDGAPRRKAPPSSTMQVGVADLPAKAKTEQVQPPAAASAAPVATSGLVVPDWVDELVKRIAHKYMLVAGPRRSLIIGRLEDSGERYAWARMDVMDKSVFGDKTLAIGGPFKNTILTRLRKVAMLVKATPFHPLSTYGGTMERSAGKWIRAVDGSPPQEICTTWDAALYNVHFISKIGATKRMGLSRATGDWRRVMGVIADADPAYPGLEDPLEIVIPCPPGGSKNVVFAVENVDGDAVAYDMHGFTISRPLDPKSRPRLSPYEAEAAYFPYMTKEGLIVMHVPD